MIFNVEGHIEKIIMGEKTQTRRTSSKYEVGKFYSIQPGRTKPADKRGKILITHKWVETKPYIHPIDAAAEGGYTLEEYEELYSKLNSNWVTRNCYEFEFWPTSMIESVKRALKEGRRQPSIPFSLPIKSKGEGKS